MNRWTMRGVAALAVISLAIAGCQNQGVDDAVESFDTLPSIDTTLPSDSMGTDGSMDMGSPSAEPSDDS
ncbi:MAG TPA: hypothetical protein VF365_06095 [Candidatus Limnocylindria bacterium]